MAPTKHIQQVEQLHQAQRTRKTQREGVDRKPNETATSAYVNLTIRRDEYHRIPYFI